MAAANKSNNTEETTSSPGAVEKVGRPVFVGKDGEAHHGDIGVEKKTENRPGLTVSPPGPIIAAKTSGAPSPEGQPKATPRYEYEYVEV